MKATPTPHSSPTKTRQESLRPRQVFRLVVLGLCIVVAGWAFATYITVRWVEHRVFSTTGWVSYVSELPQNPDVSWAVADTLVKQIFAGISVEQAIQEALPRRASFLASPLSEQLYSRSVRATQRAVESDTFQSLWTGANRLAMDRFLTNARSEKITQSAPVREHFTIDLSQTRPLLSEHLASQAELAPDLQQKRQELLAIKTNLRNRREQLWQSVRTADFLYAILPLLFAVAILTMLVLADSKRRAVMALAGASLVFLLLTLIVSKYIRGRLISDVESQYIPAVSFIYDSLVANLRQAVFYSLAIWSAVFALCLVAGPAKWAVSLRRFLHLQTFTRSRPADWWRSFCAHVARFRYVWWIGITGLVLIYLVLFVDISNAVLVNSLFVLICGMLLVQILAKPYLKIS